MRKIAILCAAITSVSAYAQDASATQAKAASTSASESAQAGQKRARRDVPWVSLAHQRELRAQSEGRKTIKIDSGKDGKSKEMNYISELTKDAAPELSADKFKYADDGSGKLVATGNARIYDKNYELTSDKVEFSQAQGYAKAEGDVKVSTDSARITANDIYLNFKKDGMKSKYIRFGSSPVFVESASLEGDKKQVTLGESVLYFGEPCDFSMSARASGISYNKETDILEMQDATLALGPVPFFYVPSYSQHGLQRPPFDINTRVGYNSDYGAFIRNNLYYNGLGDVSPGMLLDYYTKRSVLFGPAANYNVEMSRTVLDGWLQGAYINDHGNSSIRGVDSQGRAIGQDRFFADFRHKQIIDDRIGITANVSYWSDEFVTRDFRPELFYDNQVPDNFGEVVYYGDFYTGSVFSRFAPNSWETVQQRLPEVRFDVQPVEIFDTGAYQTGFVSYAYLRELDPFSSADYAYSNRADAYYGISRPIELSPWSKFTPVIGGRATYYANAINGKSDYARFLGQIGFDTQMDVWGQWEYQSKTMGIDGIRHHMIPQISYRYIPKADQGRAFLPQIDDDYLTTYPPILDLGTLRNVDQIYDTNTMRFGLQNIFETRDEEYGSREIARFDIYQDINFQKRPVPQAGDEESFSDLFINASVSPARWLTLGSYTRVNVDRIDLPETNAYIGLLDGDACSLYLIASYLQGELTQYSALAEYRISERYKVFGRWSYDNRLSMLTNQTYGLWTRMGNSWIIEYIVTERCGSTRQNNFSFGARVTMMIF